MTADVETIVVGAGVVGLAVARALAMAGHEMMVLEQHELIGSETSSRNSEVIHAGIYYPPGSLRATLCVRGKELLYRLLRREQRGRTRAAASCWWRPRKPAAQARRHPRDGGQERRHRPGADRRQRGPGAGAGARLRRGAALALHRHHRQPRLHAGAGRPHRGQRRHRSCCAVRSSASSAMPAGLFRLTTGGDNPGAITCRQPRRSRPGCTPPSWRARLASATATARRRPTTPRANTTRSQDAPHSSATSIPARRRLARPACHRRHRRALQVRTRHRLDPRASTTASSPRSSTSSSTSSAATIRASRSSACTPTTRASDPSSTARASPCPTSPSTAPHTHGQDGLVALYGIESPGLTAALAIGEVVAGLLARRG